MVKFLVHILVILFVSSSAMALIKFCSWNISHLGKKKTDLQIEMIASIINEYDIIAIQEVVSGLDGGPVAVRRIIKNLNKNTKKWKYTISPPTTSTNPQESERYAFIFNSERIKLIDKVNYPTFLNDSIVREPYVVRFSFVKDTFIVVNYHAVPKKKNPQKEIKWFKLFPQYLVDNNIIFMGDWNVGDNDSVFNPLKKQGFNFALFNQATTLKNECVQNNCLANPLDNILYNTQYWDKVNSGIIHFYKTFNYDMKSARKLSDHVPVFLTLKLKK